MPAILKNEIMIDCKGFSRDEKRDAQDALFALGYEWPETGKTVFKFDYRFLYGQKVKMGGDCRKLISWSEHTHRANKSKMVTFNELMGMAGMKKEEEAIEKIYYIDLVGSSGNFREKALGALVDHSKKTGLLVDSFKSSNSPDFCGKPEVTAYNCRYYIIGKDSIFCSNTLGHIYGPSLSKLCLYQWVDMFAEKEEATKVDNIAINCTDHDFVQKRIAQDALFKMGYYWNDPGYQNLDAYGYVIDNGKLSWFISPISKHDELTFDGIKFLSLAELVELSKGNHRVLEDCIKDFTKQSAKVDIIGADEANQQKTDRTKPRNKYDREIVPGVFVDVYDVLGAFKTDSPAIDHAAKKLLAPGKRGHKDRVTDLKEAIASIESEIAKINEWSE